MRTFLLLLILAGCGSDGANTAMEGIYGITTWTRNSMACDVEGASTATQHDPFFYIKSETIFGESFVNVKDCMDVAECKSTANDGNTIHIGQFTFEEGSDKNGWTSRSAFAFDVQGQCMGGVTERKLTQDGTGVRIEEKHFEAVPFPPSSGDDECPDAKVEAAAAGQPCDEFEVVTAAFNSDY